MEAPVEIRLKILEMVAEESNITIWELQDVLYLWVEQSADNAKAVLPFEILCPTNALSVAKVCRKLRQEASDIVAQVPKLTWEPLNHSYLEGIGEDYWKANSGDRILKAVVPGYSSFWTSIAPNIRHVEITGDAWLRLCHSWFEQYPGSFQLLRYLPNLRLVRLWDEQMLAQWNRHEPVKDPTDDENLRLNDWLCLLRGCTFQHILNRLAYHEGKLESNETSASFKYHEHGVRLQSIMDGTPAHCW
jgi:hypothetical protein